jgi:hypothetical protein
MRKSCVRLACALALALTAFGAARADILVKKTTSYGRPAAQGQSGGDESAGGGAAGQMSFTDTEMIKGRRERSERTVQIPVGKTSVPMKQVSVTQCDLKRRIDIGDATRKYLITPIGGVDETDTGGAGEAPAGGGGGPRGGVVTYTRTVTDTGERRQMFGFAARHLKTHTTMQPSGDTCQKGTLNMEQDGWYIDLDVDFECLTSQATPQRGMMRPTGCQDRIVYRNSGALKLGYALEETTRFYAPDGKTVQNESTIKVTELSRSTLDPALFDIPAGYQQASNQSELVDQRAMMQAMMQANGGGGENEGGASNTAETGAGAASGGVSASAATGGATGPKQPGTIRVGVVRVGNKTTQSVDAGTMRVALIESLNGSGVEAIPLNESAPDAAQAEARQKECDFVLFTDVSGLKQSAANKIGGMFGRATGVGAAADRFEAKVDYTLTPVGGGAPTQSSATAKEDGGADASVNSALRKEAQAVLARVRK